MRATRRVPHLRSLAMVGLVLGACAGGEEAPPTKQVVPDSSTEVVLPLPDTAPPRVRPPARDPDQEFLRAMSDQTAGLIAVGSEAIIGAARSATQKDAQSLVTREEADQKELAGLLKDQYDEELQPVVKPEHSAMRAELLVTAGDAYDRAFYRYSTTLQREAIALIDASLPRLTDASVRQVAERMRRELQRELELYLTKLGALPGS